MKKIKLKLWHKTLLALGIIGSVSGGIAIGAKIYSDSPSGKGIAHYTSKPLINDLNIFKDSSKYTISIRDSADISKKVTDVIKTDGVYYIDGKIDSEWIEDYKKKNKKTPVIVVKAGPFDFQNYYPEVISIDTFVKFIEWFSKDVSWGPELSSLSFFKLSKGIKRNPLTNTITLGSFKNVDNRTKRIEFSPDSIFNESKMSSFFIELFGTPLNSNSGFLKDGHKPFLTKSEIPMFITALNETNKKIKTKYPDDFINKTLKLYSFEKRADNEYHPIFMKDYNLTKNLDKSLILQAAEVGDVDVDYDPSTNLTTTVNKPSNKIKIDSAVSNVLIWKALAGDTWKGLSFEWLKYLTYHEYGHLQTLNGVNDAENDVIVVAPPNNMPNTSVFTSATSIIELNRYFEARVPNLKALKASFNLVKREDGNYGWDVYQDRLDKYEKDLQGWKNGTIKDEPIKPNPKDFPQIIFEYKGKTSAEWNREKIEQVFGSYANPYKLGGSPDKVNNAEFVEMIKNADTTKEYPRFFIYSLGDARKYAKLLDIPLATVYIMNAFDAFSNTNSPGITTGKEFPFSQFVQDKSNGFVDGEDNVNRTQILSEDNKFKYIEALLGEWKAYNNKPVFIKSISATPDFEMNGYKYDVNPEAEDIEGNKITENKTIFIKDIEKLSSMFHITAIKGNEFVLMNSRSVGKYTTTQKLPPTIAFGETGSNKGTPLDNQKEMLKKMIEWNQNYFEGKKKIFKITENYYRVPWNFPKDITSYWKDSKRFNISMVKPDGSKVLLKPGTFAQKIGANKTIEEVNLKGEFVIPDWTQLWIFVDKNVLIDKQYVGMSIQYELPNNKIVDDNFKKPNMNPTLADMTSTDPIEVGGVQNWVDNYQNYNATTSAKTFSTYNYNFAEVLTRDWVQLTENFDSPSEFKYPNKFIKVDQKNTGIEKLIDPSTIFSDKIPNQENTYSKVYGSDILSAAYPTTVNDIPKNSPNFSSYLDNLDESTHLLVNTIFDLNHYENGTPTEAQKAFAKKFDYNWFTYFGELKSLMTYGFTRKDENGVRSDYHWNEILATLDSNQHKWFMYGYDNLILSNIFGNWYGQQIGNDAYFQDRWLRASLSVNKADSGTDKSWALYDNDGAPISYEGTLKSVNGDEIKTRPEAFWNYYLKSNGVGIRNITSLWLEPNRDAVGIWGYLPKEYEGVVDAIKFEGNGTTKYVKIKTNNTNNLFYYKDKAATGKRWTLEDEGFVSWVTDYTVLGTWSTADVGDGSYEISFVDKNKEKVTILNGKGGVIEMTGNEFREKDDNSISDYTLTLNAYSKNVAPVYIEQDSSGKNIIHIKNEFPK